MDTYVLNLMLTKNEIDDSLHNKFIKVGANTGNNIFIEGLKEQLDYKREISVYDYEVPDDAVVVIPSSNFIMHGGNNSFYEDIINFLDNTSCKVVMVGLGAQSSRVFRTPFLLAKFGLNSIKKKCFHKIAERSSIIGIRGAFTAKCLDLMGISNYTIIGCPSYYKYFDGKYPQINQSGVENSVMSCTPSSVNETKIFEIGMKSNAIYIKQTEKEILGFEDNDNIAEMLPGMEESMYEEVYHYNEQAKLFFSIEEWNNFYENNNISFAFGTRFHGNMEALRNGVPALWITHDSRTSELIETLHLPHISLKKANNVSDVNELYELCDMQSVYSTYRELCEKYVDFLNENGVQHKFSL